MYERLRTEMEGARDWSTGGAIERWREKQMERKAENKRQRRRKKTRMGLEMKYLIGKI